MRKFKIGDHVVTKKSKYKQEKGIVIDPSSHGSVADTSVLVKVGESEFHQIWPESEIEYDKEWIREQNLNKLL